MADPRPASMSNREVLRLPEFRKLFVAQAISDIGDGMTFMALLLLVNELTHSPAALAVLSIAVAVPSMVGGVFAGAYADRLDRRRIMIVSDSIRAVLVLLFVVVGTLERLPILYLVAFLQASIGTFFSPARGALIPRVVPQHGLMAANGMGQISRMIGGLVGTGLTGVLVATSPAPYWPAFVVDATTFVASVLIVLRVDPAIGRAAAPRQGGPAARRRLGGRRASADRALADAARHGHRALHRDARDGCRERPVRALPDQRPWRERGVGGSSRGRADGLDGPRRRRRRGLAARTSAQSIVVGSLVGIGVLIAALSVVPNVLGLLASCSSSGGSSPRPRRRRRRSSSRPRRMRMRGRVIGAFQASMSTTTIVSTAAAGVFAGHRRRPAGLPGRWRDLPRGCRALLAALPRRSRSDPGPGPRAGPDRGGRTRRPARRRGLRVLRANFVRRRRHAGDACRVQRNARAWVPGRSSSRSTPPASPGASGRPAARRAGRALPSALARSRTSGCARDRARRRLRPTAADAPPRGAWPRARLQRRPGSSASGADRGRRAAAWRLAAGSPPAPPRLRRRPRR